MAEGWQRTWVRTALTVLTAAVMVMIYAFSMQDAENSDRTSGWFSRILIRVLIPDYEARSPEEQARIYDETQHVVRKCAHFSEYTLLGFVLRLCLESWFGQKKGRDRTLTAVSWFAGAMYACTDELHQLRIDGRAGQWTDVAIDSGGVLAGVLLGVLVIGAAARRKKGNPDQTEA